MVPPDSAPPPGAPAPARPALSTGLQVVLLLMAGSLVLLIAGVPGLQPVAGNGTRALRQGWAERRAAEAGVQSVAPGAATEALPHAAVPAGPEASPPAPAAGTSVDRDDANR